MEGMNGWVVQLKQADQDARPCVAPCTDRGRSPSPVGTRPSFSLQSRSASCFSPLLALAGLASR